MGVAMDEMNPSWERRPQRDERDVEEEALDVGTDVLVGEDQHSVMEVVQTGVRLAGLQAEVSS
jgi:hypothetical protein